MVAIIAAACVAGLLLLGGCALVIKAGFDEVEDELDETAISRQQFDSIELGSTRASVEAELGDPLEMRQLQEQPYGRVTCLTYTAEDQGVLELDYYELCFAMGTLYSKRAP